MSARKSLRLLNISELAEVTGFAPSTVSSRLNGSTLQPAEVRGRVKIFDAPRAVRALVACEDGTLDPGQERARLDRARAEAQEAKNAVDRGKLVSADDVVAVWSEKVVAIKGHLRALPAHAAARIPGITAAIAKRLDQLIRQILTDFADDVEPYTGRAASAQGVEQP